MRLRPCIDIHDGKVKQIVGSSLSDAKNAPAQNFVSEKDADYFASIYRERNLPGGHIILLNKKGTPEYEKDKEQATKALAAFPGGMQVGEAYFTVQDGQLTVSATLTAEGCIDKSNVYVALDALTAQTLGSNRFTGVKTRLDRPVDCGNAPYAAVMLQLTITYDPATAQDVGAGSLSIQEMRDNWNMMLITTANEAVG